MTRRSFLPQVRQLALQSALLVCGAGMSPTIWAQASIPSTSGEIPNRLDTQTYEAATPPGAATRTNAAKTAESVQGTAATRALKNGDGLSVRDGLITQVGSGRPVSEGSRVLRLPGKCTPKTNSLDCVNEAGRSATGADVSSRVQNSVINEVGAGRGATEGAGTVKRKETCTPQPGKLTCE